MSASGTRRIARLLAVAAFLAVFVVPAARAEDGSNGAVRVGRQVFDLTILRPLGLVQTAISAAAFIVAYPVALPFGGQDHCVDYLIADPVDRTFRRPLGDF